MKELNISLMQQPTLTFITHKNKPEPLYSLIRLGTVKGMSISNNRNIYLASN